MGGDINLYIYVYVCTYVCICVYIQAQTAIENENMYKCLGLNYTQKYTKGNTQTKGEFADYVFPNRFTSLFLFRE